MIVGVVPAPERETSKMAKGFEAPRQWEDWTSWVIGIGLVLSPWIFMFWPETRALENAVVCGFLLVFLEAVTLTVQRRWEEYANIALGAWLVISPFALGISSGAARGLFIVVGLIVIALAAMELREAKGRVG